MSPQCIGHGNDFFIRSFEKFFVLIGFTQLNEK